MDKRFREIVEECVERIKQGDSVQSCLEAYPEHAERLAPFLRAASIMWGANPPEPSPEGTTSARSRLLERVAEGVGKEAVMHGIFRLAQVATVAVAALFVASVGLVAAAGPGVFTKPFGGDQEGKTVAFTASVVSVGHVIALNETTLVVDSGTDYAYVRLTDKTKVQGPHGEPLEQTQIKKGDRVYVQAKRLQGRYFRALLVRLVPEDKPEAKPTATPAPEPTPAPTPAPVEAPPPATEVTLEGKIMEVGGNYFTLKNASGITKVFYNQETVFSGSLSTGVFAKVSAWKKADGTILARQVTVSAAEFWGTVVAMGEGSLTLQTESGTAIVYTQSDTVFAGTPFVGVKVWVLGYKNADGSYRALKVTVKTAEFYGTVTAMEGGTLTVFKEGTTFTVRTDANTAYPNGAPYVEAQVFVKAYRMGDGTYLAFEVTVKDWVFSGVITSHTPEQFTIQVDVGGQVREVCYEFADVIGTLEVGKTVEVHVDHVEGATHFAKLVKVLN